MLKQNVFREILQVPYANNGSCGRWEFSDKLQPLHPTQTEMDNWIG